MNTHTPHCTYNATPNTTTHSTAPAVPTCPPCNRQSTAMANIAQGYNPRTTTPATSVSIPIDVYRLHIVDEIETITTVLNNIQGTLSALHYADLSEWQVKSIAGNALHHVTTLHDIAESLLDRASKYLPNHLQGASHG